MRTLDKLFNTNEENYNSKLSLDRLILKIEELSEQNVLTFSGKLQNKNQFTAFDDRNVIGWNNPGVRRKSAYLKGEFKQKGNNTSVHLIVKPNSFLPVFGILAIIAGIVLAGVSTLLLNTNMFMLLLGILFLLLGVLYYPLSTYFRNQLTNKIVKYLDLKKIE